MPDNSPINSSLGSSTLGPAPVPESYNSSLTTPLSGSFSLSETTQVDVTLPQDGNSIGSATGTPPAKMLFQNPFWVAGAGPTGSPGTAIAGVSQKARAPATPLVGDFEPASKPGAAGSNDRKHNSEVRQFLKLMPSPTLSGRAKKQIVGAHQAESRKSALKWSTGLSLAGGIAIGAVIGTGVFPGLGTAAGAAIGGLTFLGMEAVTGLLGLCIGGKIGKEHAHVEIAHREWTQQQDRIEKLVEFRGSHPSQRRSPATDDTDRSLINDVVAKVTNLRQDFCAYGNLPSADRRQIVQAANDARELAEDLNVRSDIPVDDLVAKHENKAFDACVRIFEELVPDNDFGDRKPNSTGDLARLFANAHRLAEQAYKMVLEGDRRSAALGQNDPPRPSQKNFHSYFKHLMSQALKWQGSNLSDRQRDELCSELMLPGESFRALYAASSSVDARVFGAQRAIRAAMRHTIATLSYDNPDKLLAMKLFSEQVRDAVYSLKVASHEREFNRALFPEVSDVDLDHTLQVGPDIAAQEGPIKVRDKVLENAGIKK